jgi:hypothetical protein
MPSFPLTPTLSLGERENLRQRVPKPSVSGILGRRSARPPAPEARCGMDGPLSLSLSPQGGRGCRRRERGRFRGAKRVKRSGDSLPKGEGGGEGEGRHRPAIPCEDERCPPNSVPNLSGIARPRAQQLPTRLARQKGPRPHCLRTSLRPGTRALQWYSRDIPSSGGYPIIRLHSLAEYVPFIGGRSPGW